MFRHLHLSTCLQPDCLEATIQKKKNVLTILEFTTEGVPLAKGSISDSREQGNLS